MAQHISIRVPWKDNGYDGFVCKKPCYNNSCLRLKNIVDNRNDDIEESLAGTQIKGHETKIPCLSEGGCFMSSDTHRKMTVHPYKKQNPATHGHFLDTELVYPPYSLPARPFSWTMLKKGDEDNIGYLINSYNIKYEQTREPNLPFPTNWVQEAKNQRAIFDVFYKNVKPHKSLCIPYAKQVPFIEDAKRVVMGIGLVDKIILPVEHNHTEAGELRSITWETMVKHTIRNDRKNGFLFPYHEMMDYAEQHPEFDIRTITVFAGDEYFDEFSYATEHVSYDAVIDVLLQSLKALSVIKNCINGNWDECIAWVKDRLDKVWEDRGAYPGLGSMLSAMGFQYGFLIADEYKSLHNNDIDFWSDFEKAIAQPEKYFSKDIASSITEICKNAFLGLKDERKELFHLLARFTLTPDQAKDIFNVENRKKQQIECDDAEIIINPYILYEKTRLAKPELQIVIRKVDMAIFPPLRIREKYPLSKPTALLSDNDERRVRAIAIDILENQTANGHTVYPRNNLIEEMNNLPIEPKCAVTGDILNSISDFLSEELFLAETEDGDTAYQLARFHEIDDLIRNSISKRIDTPNRHEVNENWQKLVDDAFKDDKILDEEQEKKAREEKTAILKEIAESRLSVLVGGAGTGKTTLLSLLCKSAKISNGGILLLAPTGKARVRMSQAMQKQGISFTAETVAQFLRTSKRFDTNTMRYKLSEEDAKDVPDTVIIDECSMLTEEMFGALLQALKKNAKRIILVGDPNQLPPIGAGRPFVDLVFHLGKNIPPSLFPKVGKSYGELTITRRQQSEKDGTARMDTELAKWYTNSASGFMDDAIFEKLQANQCGENISFKMWKTNEELEKLLLETLTEEIGMTSIDDIDGFNRSLGGNVGQYTYFNVGASESAEKWQMLAPIRGMPHGVVNINHLIHQKYRENFINLSKQYWTKKIPSAMGPESIVYGDKVINLANGKRKAFPDNAEAIHYVVNGEIGIAAGGFGKQTIYLNVEFSSQRGYTYSYTKKDFGEESNAALELAYALTVHKAQGSEFEKVILVISEPCRLLSKELLYTAITRQSKKIVILYNDEAYHLRNYASLAYSDIATRFTNLFEKPKIIQVNKRYYEEKLIHRTLKNEFVRSKSEVIIANMLYENGITYEYEKELVLDGIKKIPDFTIEDAESGIAIYWEHCGMMGNTEYKKHWEETKKFYEDHGIIEGKNLIVTYDDKNGGIDSLTIKEIIKRLV